MIYLASPYTHEDEKVREQRYLAVERACCAFHARMIVVYSPIMHWHNCAVRNRLPTDHKPWEVQNYGILGRSSRMGILMIDGWRESSGIRGEFDFAKKQHVPVFGYSWAGDHLLSEGLISSY